ncbi:uncharacterized protein RCC_00950 [Ramularia collo-cygni]|uniref:Uncharacterized protein n=1 Tax=Ramularia collo-cygni TaxID=112498 RepID=A0A2D3URI0_9PEZI|nr:uncharacterized protein RCC_00950 [Ramularia collo-cygni]CZT15040.1 uncharacterized protein RCC_00950 [Ramularia collo-cygni]
MGFIHSFEALLIAALAIPTQARHLQYKHEAVQIERRQVGQPVEATPLAASIATTSAPEILTFITPSPGASPVAITEESQIVTSFVPQYTLCELPPKAFFPVTPLTSATSAPYRNYSISIPPGSGTCTTIYSPTRTMVCATTLTGLVQKYTVTNCAQDITFSTEYGFVLALPTAASNATSSAISAAPTDVNVGTDVASTSTAELISASATSDSASALITAAPTVQRITTYYLAPWQSVTAGLSPEDVELKVCALYANGTEECIRQYEVWRTSLLTETATHTTNVNISTTIQGLSQVIIGTFAANITEALTTFRMTTDLEMQYLTEYETTNRESATPSIAATNYLTRTLLEATPSATSRSTVRTTSTLYRTVTTYVGTSTALMPTMAAGVSEVAAAIPSVAAVPEVAVSAPGITENVDWVGKLGIPTARRG